MKSNAGTLAKRMFVRALAVPREQQAAARDIGQKVNGAAKSILKRQVYSIPIPRGRWRRTGELLAAEKYTVQGGSVHFQNAADHAASRAALGRSRSDKPPNRAGRRAGVQIPDTENPSQTRPVGNWQAQAVTDNREWVRERRRRAQIRALNAK